MGFRVGFLVVFGRRGWSFASESVTPGREILNILVRRGSAIDGRFVDARSLWPLRP